MSIQNWKGKLIKGSQFTKFNYDNDKSRSEEHPFAMICFSIDEHTAIAVNADPESPYDFLLKNKQTNFILDWSIPPKRMNDMEGNDTVYYYAKHAPNETKNKREDEWELRFVFHSSDHLRYLNGKHVAGPNGGAPRAVKVEGNITGGIGYTVTMFNTDGPDPVIQMAPKQMKMISSNDDKIVLRGYGVDDSGADFSDYGLTIFHKDGDVKKCILHLHDRGVDIEYLP